MMSKQTKTTICTNWTHLSCSARQNIINSNEKLKYEILESIFNIVFMTFWIPWLSNADAICTCSVRDCRINDSRSRTGPSSLAHQNCASRRACVAGGHCLTHWVDTIVAATGAGVWTGCSDSSTATVVEAIETNILAVHWQNSTNPRNRTTISIVWALLSDGSIMLKSCTSGTCRQRRIRDLTSDTSDSCRSGRLITTEAVNRHVMEKVKFETACCWNAVDYGVGIRGWCDCTVI